jgi:hypothetical protein
MIRPITSAASGGLREGRVLHEAFLPTPDYRFALAGLPRDLGGAEAVRREQNDAGTPDILLRAVPIGDDRCRALAITSRDIHHDSLAHSSDSHACESQGILKGTRSDYAALTSPCGRDRLCNAACVQIPASSSKSCLSLRVLASQAKSIASLAYCQN